MAFRAPRLDVPIDVEEHISHLPEGATIKGYCFQSAIKWAEEVKGSGLDILGEAGVSQTRFSAFLDYPYADFMRVAVTAARLGKPHQAAGKSLYDIGLFLYSSILDLHFGKIYFAVIGNDLHRIGKSGAKAWGVTLNFGKVEYEETGPTSFVYRFRDLPAFLETYQYGIITGGVIPAVQDPTIEIDLHDIGNADFLVSWT